ncbi:nucleotidyltransferase family protein [Tepidamorphus sp. 3E244]|uniref:nucleotidyltransferase family protein n=1 Tax=Tepidamorphus sp. 3E244 TaxID=3385498 RepID=UPI0038FCF086
MNGRLVPRWIARYAAPETVNETVAPAPFSLPVRAAHIDELAAQAAEHGVIMALAPHVKRVARERPEHLVSGDGAAEAITRMVDALQNAYMAQIVRNMSLEALAKQVDGMIAENGFDAVIVKGPDLANVAYGGLQHRAFSDVDILADAESALAVGDAVTAMGFKPVNPTEKRVAYTERQFWRKGMHGTVDLVEVHTDLVHAPKLRKSMSMTYADYAGGPVGVTNASRLVMAALHGAASHLFDRMRYVTDMLMVARAGVDADALVDLTGRCGANTPVRTGLALAHAIFADELLKQLGDAVPPVRGDLPARLLVTAGTVLEAQGPRRGRASWRRQAYRLILDKQPANEAQ